jgi:hypothetical protein
MKKPISRAAAVTLAIFASAAPAVLADTLLPIFFFADELGTTYPLYTSTDLQLMPTESVGVWAKKEQVPAGGDLAALKAANPSYVVVPYLNGGHQDRTVAAMNQLEADRMHLIQMYSATTLQAAINSTTDTITVVDATNIPVTGGAIDPNAPVSGNACTDPIYGKFISFIRIGADETADAELLRVVAKNGNTLTVLRHADNSKASGHPAGAKVLAPVYADEKSPRDCTRADQRQFVRYTLNIGTQQLADLLANAYIATWMSSGWDGVWMDCTAPSFYNMRGAYDEDVTPFDTVYWRDYTKFSRASAHDLKLARIQQALGSNVPWIAANNNGDGKWLYENGWGERFGIATTGGKLRAADAVVLEGPFTDSADDTTCTAPGTSFDGVLPDPACVKVIDHWKENIISVAQATQQSISVMPFIKVISDGRIPFGIDEDDQAFSWASVLLAWGPHPANSAIVVQLWKDTQVPPDPIAHELNLPSYFYDDMGLPNGAAPASEALLDKLLIGASTYRRSWTHGLVLVNPGGAADVIAAVTGYDPTASCAKVTVNEMPAYSYKILFARGYCTAWL